jgi:hypothetical protein
MPENITDTKSITELKIISNIHKFEWNFAEIKQSLESKIEKYVGLVVNEENLKDMEVAQKEVVSIRTMVDGFRKSVKKEMEKPYKVFEGEIKELLQLVEKVEIPLKDQTLKYEQDRIAAKEVELNKFAQTTALNMGVRNNYFNFVVDSQWTKRTAKEPAVRKEIVVLIEAMLESQRRADELEELEKQRVGLIEGQCKVHSASLKTPVVPSDVNHLLVGVTLTEIPGIIMAECQKRAEMEAKAAAPVVEESPAMVLPHEVDPSHDWVNEVEGQFIAAPDPYPEWEGSEINYAQPAPMPPLPPIPQRNYPPASSVHPQLFNCVIKYKGITAQDGAAIKTFTSSRGLNYEIISQQPVRGDF